MKVLANYEFGRNLLLKVMIEFGSFENLNSIFIICVFQHYKFFTADLVRKNDMNASEMDRVTFKIEFFGKGWKNKKENINEDYTEKPDQLIHTQITGPEPGYIATSRIVVSCALVLLQEQDKIPVKGGCITPAIAFGNTTLIDRLQKQGIKFENLS
jgi:hypothetical protein